MMMMLLMNVAYAISFCNENQKNFQKSSAIQNNFVTLSLVGIAIIVCSPL